jgi:spore coat polysaccharide biosynthesis protein SpsF (cytidylyltransferase family)
MLNTLGIVQLRLAGGPMVRGRSRAADRRLGGTPLLEWVVRRVTDCELLDGVIVVLGDSTEEAALAQFVPPDVPVFVHGADDPLARYAAALDEYQPRAIVRVCVDNLFIDPALIDRLVCAARSNDGYDYVGYCLSDGTPTIRSPLGVFGEWCSADALRMAHREAKRPEDRQQVTSFLYSQPDKFKVRLMPVPPEFDRADVRLSIDTDEDWEHAEEIYEAIGPDELNWRRIAGLLDQQPALRRRMADLNRACDRV